MLTVPQALLAGLLLMSVLMTLLWLWQRAHTDAGIVDVGWASGLGVLAVLDAVVMPGDPARRVLVAALAGIWSFRLGWHLLTDRIVGKPEDGRYQTLREQWAPHAQRAFFFFFQAQALAAVLFSLPFVAAMHHARPLGAWDAAAACVWLIAFTGETSADAQLAAWRRDPAHRGSTCRAGLWAWSRHPNYFFEWLYWWVYVLLAIGSPYAALVLLAPAVMLFLLFRVTGIPATEARALASRGEDYREYQRTTSVFIPFPPRGRT